MSREPPEQAVISSEAQAALADRVTRGDPAAEEELVRTFGARVLMLMVARTREPEAARDLSQEVFIAVVRALRDGQLRDTCRLAAFVHGIARNTANNYLRTQRRNPILSALPESIAARNGADPVEALERRELVRLALAAVPPTDRAILTLTLIDGLKPGEIADRLGLDHDVVRARKSRALRKVIERVRELSQR